MADYPWVNLGLISGAGAYATSAKIDSSGADFALGASAYIGLFLGALNPGGVGAMDVVVPPGGTIKIQMYSPGSLQVIAPTTLGGGTYSGSQLTMAANGTPTWDIPPGRALRCYATSSSGGTFHFSTLRLPTPPPGTPYWWGPATLGGTAVPGFVPEDPRGVWVLPAATPGQTLIGSKAWTGTETVTVPFYRTGTGTINAKLTAATGTATLITADGAAVNGDGSLTIPADTHLFPSWTATDGATLTLTKGAGGGHAFYGPAYVTTTVPAPPPSIASLVPTTGTDAGGTTVNVIGSAFTGDATSVTFDGTPGTGLTVVSDALIEVTSPAHAAGAVDVTVTTADGTDTLIDGYSFTGAGVPTITSATPTEGPTTGGTSVLLVGTDLAAVTGVTFDGTTVPPSTVLDTAVIATSPSGAEGVTTLTVTDGAATSNDLAWEYTEAPPGPVVGDDLLANLVALLTDQLDGVTVASRRPATDNLGSDPTVVVRLTGGQLSGVIADSPTVTVEAWAPTTIEASALLSRARNSLRAAAHEGRSGLRRYREFAGPADLPDPDTTNPRYTLTASLVTRADL